MLLIVLGGLGWRVTSDLWSNRQRLKRRNLSLHTRLVLRTSILLILIGTLGLLLTESLSKGHILTSMGWPERLMSALFESVSARTARIHHGSPFESVSDSGLLLLMTLMFIGASPGGTGGGIKTTTVAALMAATRSTLRGQDDVVDSSSSDFRQGGAQGLSITMASLMFVLVMALLLALSTNQNGEEPLTFLELLFPASPPLRLWAWTWG